MKVVNQSLVPAERLQPVVRFLKSRFPQAKSTRVLLTSVRDPEAPNAAFMTGDAFPSGGWAQELPERHFVRVYIPTLQRPYPTSQQNPAGQGDCPRVTLRNWEDELVLVLAHELAHVAQFEEQGPTVTVAAIVADEDERFEVQAERAAAIALTLWHQQQSLNQCDGCCAGIPLQGGLHNMGRPGGYRDLMTCERSKYETA